DETSAGLVQDACQLVRRRRRRIRKRRRERGGPCSRLLVSTHTAIRYGKAAAMAVLKRTGERRSDLSRSHLPLTSRHTTSPLVFRTNTLPLANAGAVKALPPMTCAEPSSL